MMKNKFPVITAKEFYNRLLRYGCTPISTKGSHFKVEYPKTGKHQTVPIHSNRDIKPALMKCILTRLGIDIDDFLSKL